MSASSGIDEALAYDERPARPVQRVALGRVPQQRVEDPVQERLHLVEDDALARESRGGSDQLRPRHRAPPGMSLPQAERGPRHGHGHRACVEDLLRIAVVDDEPDELVRRGGALRHGHEEIEQPRASLCGTMDEQEPAAARTGERALADPGDGRGRDARVDGVSARAQNVRPGFGSEWMPGC